MILYYVNIDWKEEVSPIIITTDFNEADDMKDKVENNFRENGYDVPNIWIDSKEVNDTLLYNCDWFRL